MEKVHGVLVMILLEMLQFLVLIIVHHLILIMENFLVLGEGPTQGINEGTGSAEKTISISFNQASTKFYLSLHCNGDESHLYVNKTDL